MNSDQNLNHVRPTLWRSHHPLPHPPYGQASSSNNPLTEAMNPPVTFSTDTIINRMAQFRLQTEGANRSYRAPNSTESIQPPTGLKVILRWITEAAGNALTLREGLQRIWKLRFGATFQTTPKRGLFVLQLNGLEDYNKILQGSPWLFRGDFCVVEPFQPGTHLDDLAITHIPLKVHFDGLPLEQASIQYVKGLAETIGISESVTEQVRDQWFLYPVVQIRLPIDSALPRTITYQDSAMSTTVINLKYERLTRFCHFCGKLGHVLNFCGIRKELLDYLPLLSPEDRRNNESLLEIRWLESLKAPSFQPPFFIKARLSTIIRIQTTPCVLCNHDEDSMLHVFDRCLFTQGILTLQARDGNQFRTRFHALATTNRQSYQKRLQALWLIWKERCSRMYEQNFVNSTVASLLLKL